MVKSYELRKGNWLKRGEENDDMNPYDSGIVMEIYYGESIEYSYDGATNGISKTKCEDLDGILITEECLLRIEFKKIKGRIDGLWLDIQDLSIHFSDGFLKLTSSYDGSIDLPTKYIHQLQNLYYTLTGDELTVKL